MNKLLSIKQIAIIAGAYLLCSCPVKADIRMPRIFGDHMVLQQDSQVSIWGWEMESFFETHKNEIERADPHNKRK